MPNGTYLAAQTWSAMLAGAALGLAFGVAMAWLSALLPLRLCGLPRRPVRWRWPLAVAWCAGFGALAGLRYGISLPMALAVAGCSLMGLVALIDLEHRVVPNALVAAGCVLGLLSRLGAPWPAWRAALIGALLAGVSFALLAAVGRGAMGAGDVKLALLIGWWVAYPAVVRTLALGIVLGGIAAGFLLATGKRRPKQYMAYAPYLAAGCALVLVSCADGCAGLLRAGW